MFLHITSKLTLTLNWLIHLDPFKTQFNEILNCLYCKRKQNNNYKWTVAAHINQSAVVITTTSAVKTIPRARTETERKSLQFVWFSANYNRRHNRTHSKVLLWCDSWTILVVRGCGSWGSNNFLFLPLCQFTQKSGHITTTTLDFISGHLHYNTWMWELGELSCYNELCVYSQD